MTTKQDFEALWEKYLDDQRLSAHEIKRLKLLIQDERNQEQLAQFLTGLYDQRSLEKTSAESNAAEAFEAFWTKLHNDDPQVDMSPVISTRSGFRWWRYAAAAALVAITAGIAYKWNEFTGTKTSLAQLPAAESQVKPGGNKAMLTLADGSVIVLTDAEDGTLARQGNTRVVKLANGQLAYESGRAAEGAALLNTIVTPRGGKYQITLPDGTKVWLNAASSLRYPAAFTKNAREVSLTGEAWFDVAGNATSPFIVNVNDTKVEVLGTQFNIMAYDNEASVATTLLDGAVRVNYHDQKVQLQPGQQAVGGRDGKMSVINDVNTKQVTAWKNDYFQFNADQLDLVMRQLERWYDVSVKYEGGIPNRKFGGKISRSSPLSDVLKALELSNVKCRLEGRTIVVTNN